MKRALKLNTIIIGALSLLLAVLLGIMFYFSHMALKEEAMRDAEQTLEGTVQNIDNILLSVEQGAGNVYFDMMEHLDAPERMYTYCREIVKANPDVVGCAIAFKPGFYPGRDLFMPYVRRGAEMNAKSTDLVVSDHFTDRPYTEQRWYKVPMETGYVGWLTLKGKETEREPLVTFCLPFSDQSGQRVGVMGIDVALSQLSEIVLAAKPSEEGYCVLMESNGQFIVHPDPEKRSGLKIFTQDQDVDYRLLEAVEEMTAGKTGNRIFHIEGRDWRTFYKPFQRVKWEGRSEAELGWSVAVIYPIDDIHGEHYLMLFIVIVIAIAGIAALYFLSRWAMRKNLVKKPVLAILLMAIPVYLVSLVLFYTQSRYLIHRESMEYADSQLKTALERVENYMKTIETPANSNAWMIEADFTPENIKEISNRIVRLNGNVVSSSVFAQPNTFTEYGEKFSVYTERKDDTVKTFLEPDYDYLNKQCFTKPIKTGEDCWVDPFIEYAEGRVDHSQAIATYCKPLKDQEGNIMGVLTTDFSFSKMAKIINEDMYHYHGSYYILLGGDGRYLMHPSPNKVFRKTIFTDIDPVMHKDIVILGRRMIAGEEGTEHIKWNGKLYHVCFKPVPGTNWSLALICEDSDFMEGFHK